MIDKQILAEHVRILKNVEKRLRQVERRLKETDDKLDHIIFRLMEEDPRIYHQDGNRGNGNGSCGFKDS